MKFLLVVLPLTLLAACQYQHSGFESQSPLQTYAEITQSENAEISKPEDVQPTRKYRERGVREMDLDHDGINELFVDHPRTLGNAGLNHTIYRRQGDRYQRVGTLFFHPLAIKVLAPTDEHPIRLIRYWRTNASEGSLDTIGYENGEFIVLSKETIYPGDGGTDEGRARYAELFGTP